MSPLTPLHYLLIASLVLLFIIGVILSARTKSPYSILTTITGILALIGAFTWISINKLAYRVEITNVKEEHYYQSEQILITGIVRNIGDYPINNVIAVVKMTNLEGANSEKANQFSQPTVFAEIYEGDNPNYKRQNIVERHVIADSLQARKSKPFHIVMPYPSYFKKAAFHVTGEVD
jgi:hypothetical protein